jgi:hypothetical protein
MRVSRTMNLPAAPAGLTETGRRPEKFTSMGEDARATVKVDGCDAYA